MLKVCTLFKRKAGLSVSEYQSYWGAEHPNFVKRLPGILGYTQNPPLAETFETDTPIYDGIVELLFPDSAALKHLSTTKEYEELNRDEEQFVDRSTIRIVLTDESVLKDSAAARDKLIKRVTFFKRSPGLSPEEFQQLWRENYGSAVAALPAVQRYVQSTPRLAGYRDGREPEWDGIDMCWFSSLQQARQDGALASLDGLIDRDVPNRLYTRESVVIKPRA
jgi:uncharacterized protein (TIGR02118 family)